jgi:hypothetical protein
MRRFAKTCTARGHAQSDVRKLSGRADSLRANTPRKSPRRISTPAKTTLFAGRVDSLRANTPRKSPRRIAKPAKTTLFAGRVDSLRANTPRKSPQAISAH